MSQPKVLFVLTSHGWLGNTGKPSGWYLPELVHPYEILAPHVQIVIASPKGGEAPLDPGSVEATRDDIQSQHFFKTKEALWKKTEKLSSFLGKAKEFEAIFFVGGHGPMFDLATDATSHKLVNEFYDNNKIISAVCHGPAAFVNVKFASGVSILEGHRVTGISNYEEEIEGVTSVMPLKLENELNRLSGGKYEKGDKEWSEKVVVARRGYLITGQNPASAAGVGKAIYNTIFGKLTTTDM